MLEYFDAYLIGLTATPGAHTFGFFNQNLVMEYPHEQAVADGVNVDFQVYRVRTRITEQGSVVEASNEPGLGIRDRRTRRVRWQAPDEPLTYGATDLDRNVVAPDQIRLLVRTFKERLFTEIFPGRTEVPKTLIFAKDDSHAEDIVGILREEFGRGNDFCQKITYRTTGRKPKDLIQEFRISYLPRIAVTVDMIATGTDVKPIEIVVFMRAVHSRVLFEQMKGRGVRVIDADELQGVTPDARAKTHFVIVDCVGLAETDLADTRPLERKRTLSLKALLEHVAAGGTDPDVLSSLASRLARLDRQCGPTERQQIGELSGGASLAAISHAIVEALDPDVQAAEARRVDGYPRRCRAHRAPGGGRGRGAAEAGRPAPGDPAHPAQAIGRPSPPVRASHRRDQQGRRCSRPATPRRPGTRLAPSSSPSSSGSPEHRDEVAALQVFYSQPYSRRLRFADIKALAETIKAPPRSWTPERLWRAYELLERDKVRGASAQRLLTDIVSLLRFALHKDPVLVPHAERVNERFDRWMTQQDRGAAASPPPSVSGSP